ncbi:MAG: glutamine--fructose-6-phosphate transaminase (isomerizing), partial [Pseudolysinimonas sp.]
SDVAAFVEHTRHALEIGQDQIVTIRPGSVEVMDFAGTPVTPHAYEIAWDASASEKGGWPSFMKKEISEEPEAVAKTLLGRVHDGAVVLPELEPLAEVLGEIDRVVVIACGTAAYAGMLGKYAIEAWARVPVDVELSHEFRYRDPVLTPRTLVVSVSQSGETMDTLMAVKYAREQGARTLSICNTQGSTIPRESDAVLYTHAGPEVAVASTKAFVAQVTALYLLGLYLAQRRGTLDGAHVAAQVTELQNLPDKLEQVVESASSRIAELAHWMGDTQSVLFLGRNVGYPIALEGALKLKELAYIHAEGFAAGELKHGPIALIEPGQIVFVVVPSPRDPSSLHPKVVSNIQEIRARGARVIAIAEIGDVAVVPFADEVIRIPFAAPLFEPLLAVVPLHIFGMELAMAKGLDVDQPRNLAKSVTVE